MRSASWNGKNRGHPRFLEAGLAYVKVRLEPFLEPSDKHFIYGLHGMTSIIEQRLADLGIELPEVAAPVANYMPFARTGSLVFVSGQLPLKDGALIIAGKVGERVSLEEAIVAARQCALNIIAQLKSACDGNLNRVHRIVKISGFVAATPAFTDYPTVINGASDILVDIFRDAGRHSRLAVGCSSLPMDAPVEVEAIAALS